MNSEIDYSGQTTPEKINRARLESESSAPDKIEQVENPGSTIAVDAETEKRLLRKLDIRIIPMICWIYLMNFMDRGMSGPYGPCNALTMQVNIGNARLYKLEDDLGMSGNQYQLAVGILFVTYCVGESLQRVGR